MAQEIHLTPEEIKLLEESPTCVCGHKEFFHRSDMHGEYCLVGECACTWYKQKD